MKNKIKRWVTQHKKITIITTVLVLLLLFLLLHKHSNSHQTTKKWVTVQPREAIVSIHKYGKITTGHNFSVTAPFDGKILKMNYDLGDRVTKGQVLLVLSKEGILKKLHQAKSDFLQKREDYEKYLHWETGSEVQKAKQDMLNAQQQLKISKEKLKDDQFLYDKGIISRDELDQQKQTVMQNQQQIDSTKLSLADTLKQGDEDNLLIKKLAMEDAQNTLDTINKQISHATIVAPATGVALKPTQTGGKDSTSFTAVEGEAVTENQNLLTIGNSENLEVTGKLNQEEINRISIGLSVTITSDAFPGVTLTGKVDSISRLADESSSSSPTFPFTVALATIPEKERKLMRMGLMVDISLETYRNDKALVVPVEAISSEGGKDYVWARDEDGQPEKRLVKRGPSLPEGVVIKEGLKTGEQVRLG